MTYWKRGTPSPAPPNGGSGRERGPSERITELKKIQIATEAAGESHAAAPRGAEMPGAVRRRKR